MHSSTLNIDFSSFPIFKDFDLEQIQKVLALSSPRQLSVGEVLIERGEDNDSLYILVEGQLSIVVELFGLISF